VNKEEGIKAEECWELGRECYLVTPCLNEGTAIRRTWEENVLVEKTNKELLPGSEGEER